MPLPPPYGAIIVINGISILNESEAKSCLTMPFIVYRFYPSNWRRGFALFSTEEVWKMSTFVLVHVYSALLERNRIQSQFFLLLDDSPRTLELQMTGGEFGLGDVHIDKKLCWHFQLQTDNRKLHWYISNNRSSTGDRKSQQMEDLATASIELSVRTSTEISSKQSLHIAFDLIIDKIL